jgi:hypothetical protein
MAQVQATTAASIQRRDRNGARFSLEATRQPARSAVARAAIPLANMDAILALQGEEENGRDRRRRHARRGSDILDALDGLKAALLGGRVAPADVHRILAVLRAGFGPSGDPGLDAVVAQIELRAEVELAKLAAAGMRL